MNKKSLLISLVLFLLITIGIYLETGCAPNKTQRKDEEVKQAGITQTSIQEWKTYTSKYGFSVSYPAEWKLEEENDIKPSEDELAGYKNFSISSTEGDVSVALDFTFNKGIVENILSNQWEHANKNIPKEPKEKIFFLAERTNSINRKMVKDLKRIKVEGGEIYIEQYKDEQYSETTAMFYIKKTDTLVNVILIISKDHKYVNNVREYRGLFLDFMKRVEIYK